MTYRFALSISFLTLALSGCSLDRTGVGGGARDGGVEPVDAALDAQLADAGDASLDGSIELPDGGDAGMPEDGGQDAGSSDAGPDAGPPDAGQDAGMLDAGCSGPPTCSGDTLIECVGGGISSTTCPLGCSAGACRVIVPSNVGGAVSFSDGTADLDVNGELWLVFPDTGLIEARTETTMRVVRSAGVGTNAGIRYAQVAGTDGASYGVFVFGSLRVRANGVLAGTSGSTRSLVLISAREVLIEGYVVVRGTEFGPGPGGGAGGARQANGSGAGAGGAGLTGTVSSGDDGGGGGGSYGTSGASGGSSPTQSGGSAGSTYGGSELVPLRGGSGGGGGGDDDGGRGGHGGGAIQITSATTITVTASGGIDAGGEGGRGGNRNVDAGAGGGGGSGGAILLEAITVTVAANRVGATGGAGGQGGRGSTDGVNGTDGSIAMVPAAGSGSNGGSGGGGAGSNAAGVAAAGSDAENGGGGGGGGGRIRINNATGTGTYAVVPSVVGSVGMVSRTP